MTPMDALAQGKTLVIWPHGLENRRLWFVVAGYSRLRYADCFFRDTWWDGTFAGHSALLLDGHAEQVQPDVWKVPGARAEIRVMDEDPYRWMARMVRKVNAEHGGTQARFDEMAAICYGDGSNGQDVPDG